MKHTPGPWIADRNGLGELAIFTAKGKHTLSCEGDSPLPLRQREANAELQAAAPVMYKALKAIPDSALNCEHKYPHTYACWNCIVRAALAQAEGK